MTKVNIKHHLSTGPVLLKCVLLNPDLSIFENTVDQDQLASDEAI